MNWKRRLVVLAAGLLLAGGPALAACGGHGVSADDGDQQQAAADMVGHTYLSTAVRGAQIPGGGPLELSFPESGRISVTAGCNRHSGAATFDGDQLRVGQLASTAMACVGPAAESDSWITDFFAEPVTWTLPTRTTLQLRRADGQREVTLEQRQNKPVAGPTWTVTSLVTGQAVETSAALEQAKPHLVFADGKVSGFTGCNTLSGTAEISGDAVAFGAIATTKMACPPDIDRIEKIVLATIDGSATYGVDGDVLSLTNAANPDAGLRLQAD